jgi:plastocyanin
MRTWLAAAALAAVGGGTALVVTAAADTSIAITSGNCPTTGGGVEFCFVPEGASGQTGSAVTWTNQSGAPHSLTQCTTTACPGAPASTGSDSFTVPVAASNGSSGSFTFSDPGTYVYYCTIHGYAAMHGTLTIAAASPPPTVPDLLAPGLGLGAGVGAVALFVLRRHRRRSA